jgi:phosphate/phosphite/phosphonate ABC transporter binding protein
MDRLVLGLVPSDRLRARDPRTRQLMRAIEERTGAYVVERNVASYEELEQDMTLARIDVAWLPPVVYARLERDDVATALLARAMAGRRIWSALVVAAGSAIQSLPQLAQKRVAWVDPLSASGYLVARMGLRARRVEPRMIFGQQFFAGSHNEAVSALLEGRADVAATFVHLDESDRVVRGPWDEMGIPADRLRVIALLGEIPPDVIAARTSVPEPVREALAGAILAMAHDPELGAVVEAVFGAREFARGTTEAHAALRVLLERSAMSMRVETDAYGSTSPPSKLRG